MLQDNWLGNVGHMCSSTLESLNMKAERGHGFTDDDKLLRDVCLGYLYMLSLCNQEGIVSDSTLPNNLTNNRTIH